MASCQFRLSAKRNRWRIGKTKQTYENTKNGKINVWCATSVCSMFLRENNITNKQRNVHTRFWFYTVVPVRIVLLLAKYEAHTEQKRSQGGNMRKQRATALLYMLYNNLYLTPVNAHKCDELRWELRCFFTFKSSKSTQRVEAGTQLMKFQQRWNQIEKNLIFIYKM